MAEEVPLSTGQHRTEVLRLALLHDDDLVVLLHVHVFWVGLTQKLVHLRGVSIILKVQRLFQTRHPVVKITKLSDDQQKLLKS